MAKQFLPQSVQRNFCRAPAFDQERVSQNLAQDMQSDVELVGNEALCDRLSLHSEEGLYGRVSGDEEHPLEGVLGQVPFAVQDFVGSPGWVMEDADVDTVDATLRSGAEVDGVWGTLEQRQEEAGPYCETLSDCDVDTLLALQQLRVSFDVAVEGFRASLADHSEELLAQGSWLRAGALQFGFFARLAARSAFSAAAGAVAGPVAAFLAGGVGYSVGSAVKKSVLAYADDVDRSGLMTDGMIDAFFRSQSLAWNLGMTRASEEAFRSGHSDRRAFKDALRALSGRPDLVTRGVRESLLPSFLRLAAHTRDRPDELSGLDGGYHFTLEFELGEQGRAEPRKLCMPTAMTPEDSEMLLSIPGLLHTQAFKLVSHDRTVIGSVNPDGAVSVDICDPARAPLLRSMGIPDAKRRTFLELRAEQGDQDAIRELDSAAHRGLETIWDAMLRRMGTESKLDELRGVSIEGVGR